MRQQTDVTYDEFLKAMRECERAGQRTSYRNIVAICGGSNATIRKYLERYIKEMGDPVGDVPLSLEITRAISREIQRQVAFIGQEQRERIEQVDRLIEDATGLNDELQTRCNETEQSLAALREAFGELQARHDKLNDSTVRERKSAADALATSQSEVANLRQQVNDLNIDNGRMAANLEQIENQKRQLLERLAGVETALAETRQGLQVREIAEARLDAELHAANENLSAHKGMLAEAEHRLNDVRGQLLEAERRSAAMEALRTEQQRDRYKGAGGKPSHAQPSGS